MKNFRNESYKKEYYNSLNDIHLGGSTHPHQIHLEILSELGLFGYLLIMSNLIYILFNQRKNNNFTKFIGISFLVTSLIPFLPSGSFFTSYGATLFFINYSFLIDLNPKIKININEQTYTFNTSKQRSRVITYFLKELEKYSFNKIVVLQKEDEETINSISNFKDISICYQKNNGYGNALKEGIENIKTEFFCIINADGSMDPKYLEEMLLSCENRDFVFASRYLKGGGSDDDDLITFVGNKCFSFMGNILFGLNLSDILYTYVVGKTNSAKSLLLRYNDFRICLNCLYLQN